MCKAEFPVPDMTDVKGRLFCPNDYARARTPPRSPHHVSFFFPLVFALDLTFSQFMAQVEARRKQLAAQGKV